MDGQVELSQYLLENGSLYERPLLVAYNGKISDMSYKDIFDASKFDTIKCETYVSSVGFIMDALKNFKSAQIIVGIGKDNVTKAFAENISSRFLNDGAKYFIKLKDADKDKIINNEFEFKYPQPDIVVHDKLYLLSNSATNETRVIYGSVNLTQRAFSNNIRQYEIAIVEDNSPLFEEFSKRFYAVHSFCEDYIPREIKEKYINKEQLVYIPTTDEQVENIISKIKEDGGKIALSEDLLDEWHEAIEEDEENINNLRASFEILNLSTKRKKSNITIKTDNELLRAKKKIRNIIVKRTKKESEINRFCLKFDAVSKAQYRIFTETKNDEIRPPELFSRKASEEEIRQGIENILAMIEGYKKYTINSERLNEYAPKVLETIFYGFMSSYVFRLRQETIKNKEDIPLMLVLGGRSGCGKSGLLAYINVLLSGVKAEQSKQYFDYKKYMSKGNVIESLMYSDNTFPILIDEVSAAFFTSKAESRGETLIKSLANTLENEHPTIICTTNTKDFVVPQQVARRIYYLQIESTFDDKIRAESSEYYNTVIADANNLLFRDFCFRVDNIIKNGESLFDEKETDFLYIARRIFEKYFEISNIAVPLYFPKEIIRDYAERGRQLWKVLYQQDKDKFYYNKYDGVLSVNFEKLTRENKKMETYLGYLRQDILVEDGGLHVVLRAKPFFEWIDEKNEKAGFFEKLKNK